MSTADLNIIVNGTEVLALIAAAWSVVFFGRVKLSSPAQPKAAQQPEATAQPAPVQEIAARRTG